MSKLLTGDGTWHLFPTIVGDDICVHDQIATWFGGDSGPQDDGETASGIRTKSRQLLMGCSVPLQRMLRPSKSLGTPEDHQAADQAIIMGMLLHVFGLSS